MKKFVTASLVAMLLAGCASKGTVDAPVVDKPVTAPESAVTKVEAVTAPVTDSGIKSSRLTDPKDILSTRTIFFEYDSVKIRPEFEALIQAHAKFLNENRSRRIRIEGHADERGSREYNVALGQRRADAVRKAMNVLGVGDDRIETVSFGEDKPKAAGHDEAAWAQNRRAEIAYDGE